MRLLHTEYLRCLERSRSIEAHVFYDALGGHAQEFLDRHWIVADGHLTSILVPVLDSEEEVEICVHDENQSFSYRSPAQPGRIITRALAEITSYVFNIDAWVNALADVLEVEPSKKARIHNIVDGHLWHVGDLRIGRTHHFAPVYVARRLGYCRDDWRKPMFDAVRPGSGIVLSAIDIDVALPNGHQSCRLDSLLIGKANDVACDSSVLERFLRGVPADATGQDEWFNEKTGELKLLHMSVVKIFRGKQAAVIATFWKNRHQKGVKWSDVMERTGCSKDPGSVFGKGAWKEWIEKVDYSCYRIRWRQPAH